MITTTNEIGTENIYDSLPEIVLREIKKSEYVGKIFVDGQEYGSTKFDREHILGQGLVATVLKLDQEDSLVVKLFPASKNVSDTKTLFSDSIVLSHKLQHPNIARPEVIGIAKFGNLKIPCTIEEKINNNLKDKTQDQPLTLSESIEMVKAVSSALQYIYQETGEIVVDLSPNNINQKSDTDKTWCISDLEGTAKNGSHKNISIDPVYSAPECKNNPNANDEASEKSMVYSLSLIMWHSLTGKTIPPDINVTGLNDVIKQGNIPEPVYKVIQAGARMTNDFEIKNPLDFYKKIVSAYESIQEQS